MEPRPEGRGDVTPECTVSSTYASFNGATARRPWRPQALALEGEKGGFSSAPLVTTPKVESRNRPCHPRGDLV